jgi:hypothetical protein
MGQIDLIITSRRIFAEITPTSSTSSFESNDKRRKHTDNAIDIDLEHKLLPSELSARNSGGLDRKTLKSLDNFDERMNAAARLIANGSPPDSCAISLALSIATSVVCAGCSERTRRI